MHLFPQTVSLSEVAVKSENQADVLALREGRRRSTRFVLFLKKSSCYQLGFLKYFCSSCTFFVVLSLKKAFADVAVEQGCWVDVELSSGSGC